MQQSPLDAQHRQLGARLVEFAGWSMPVQYQGVLAEHNAVRQAVGVFDVSHLGRFRVSGKGTTRLLRRMLCNDIQAVKPGRAQYSMVLNDAGGVEDDIIVWRLGDEEAIVLPNGANDARIQRLFQSEAADSVGFEPLRETTVLLAVQGRTAPELLEATLGWRPQPFRLARLEELGEGSWGAGTGYTGEPGGELALGIEAGREVFAKLLTAGVVPCGLGARDTLRLEMGYPLWGQDLDPTITPLEADLGWVINWNHDFRGKSALERQRKRGLNRVRLGFSMQGPEIPRRGYRLRAGGSEGTVTSGNFSPVRGKGIGMGYLSPPPVFHRGSRIDGVVEPPLQILVRGEWLTVKLQDPPFIPRP